MADSQNLIGQGMGIAMDEIWRALFGNAAVKARQGQPITAGDVGDTAFTVGLNSLPFGGGGAAARGAQVAANSPEVARMLALQALRNPNIVSRQGVNALEQMARSGDTRFKNMFDMNIENVPRYAEYQQKGLVSADELSQEALRRAASEEAILGIPMNAPASARPTYGIVTPALPGVAARAPRPIGTPQNAVQEVRSLLSPRNPQLDEFGANGANVFFKPRNLDRVTTTAGDVGAGSFGGVRGAAEEIGTAGVKNVAEKSIVPYKSVLSPAPFLEAQMYGADLAKASKVTVPTKEAQKRLQELFKQAGIKVPVKLDRGARKQSARQRAVEARLERLRNQERAWEPEM